MVIPKIHPVHGIRDILCKLECPTQCKFAGILSETNVMTTKGQNGDVGKVAVLGLFKCGGGVSTQIILDEIRHTHGHNP